MRSLTMSQEKQERIKACLQDLATLLYSEADKSQLIDLEGIEKTVRSQILEYVGPEIALFLSNKQQKQKSVKPGKSLILVGELKLKAKQIQRLGLKPRRQVLSITSKVLFEVIS